MWKGMLLLLVLLFATYLIDSIFVKLKAFERVFNHYPGSCALFTMNGAEDMLILPNNHTIISGGFDPHGIGRLDSKGALYVLDMSDPRKGPKKLDIEGSYLIDHPDLMPHGISSWVAENGDIFIYVVCHWSGHKDSIEVFQYYPSKASIRYVQSISDDNAVHLNDLTVVDKDEFYVTNWRYFNNGFLHLLEQLLRLPLTKVYHVKNGKFSIVKSGFYSANGIHISRNGKFIYIVNSLIGEVTAHNRSEDGSLTYIGGVDLGAPLDNINVDPVTGYLWVPMFIKPLETLAYLKDPKQNPGASTAIVHITSNELADNPFENSKVELVYSSDGSNEVGAISSALYANGTLLLGSVATNMLICDVHYLEYN